MAGPAEDFVDLAVNELVFEHGGSELMRFRNRVLSDAKVTAEDSIVSRAASAGIGKRQRFGRSVAGVVDFVEGPRRWERSPVAAAGRAAVRVDEMDMAESCRRRAERRRDVDLFDIHVKQIGQQLTLSVPSDPAAGSPPRRC